MGFLRKRFAEPSSWAGLGAVITAAAQAAATRDPAAVGTVVAGLLAILLPERKAA